MMHNLAAEWAEVGTARWLMASRRPGHGDARDGIPEWLDLGKNWEGQFVGPISELTAQIRETSYGEQSGVCIKLIGAELQGSCVQIAPLGSKCRGRAKSVGTFQPCVLEGSVPSKVC